MIPSDNEFESSLDSDPLSFFPLEENEIFDENIDAYDAEMDNDDDGIEKYDIDPFEDDSEEDDGDDEDNIIPYEYNDEFADYDELED
ncbi:MAG: hypothetical protein PQJ50_05265 [Spirochaetales bacterium]|nr:hypothetical protein [Spirochaetales bacterium]